MLRNANGRMVIGNPRRQQDAYWIPVESRSTVVGYLGFVRRINIDDDLDRLFAERVENYLTWLLLGMLLITGLVAIPLAAGLVRPVERLRSAVRELASGNFELSLERHGNVQERLRIEGRVLGIDHDPVQSNAGDNFAACR